MARLSPDKVAKRSGTAWRVKDQWRDLRTSAYELALPHRNPYHSGGDGRTKQTPGVRKMDRVFDSTLMTMTTRLANRLQTELTPPFQKWSKLVPGAFIPDQNKAEVQKRLDPLTDAMFAAIHVSNFDTAINEFFLDLAIGTGVMMVMKGDDEMPVRYICVPQAQVAFEEGPWGGINGVYRKHSMKVRLIEETWKGFEFKKPEGFDDMVEDDGEKEINLIEATYWDAKDEKWYYEVLWEGPSSNSKSKTKRVQERIIEDEFDESPWIVARWIKVPGEVEGRGPVLFALPDAKTLNKLKELVLMNASIAVSGVWTAVDDGVLNPNTVRIQPGAVVPVARNGGALGASLQPLKTGADFNVASILGEDLISSIKKIMMDSTLPPETGTPASATEIIARLKDLQSDIGSSFGRLMTELIRPLVQKTLAVLAEMKIIALQPGQKIKVNGGTVDVQVQSPLAQAQGLNEVQTAVQWMSLVQNIGPEAFLLGVNIEDAPEWLGRKMGVAGELMRTREQRSQVQKLVGALAAQQQQGAGALPANDNPGAVQAAA
jgi:hypothetical protein